ncbi:MAG: hypothetical protein L3J41_03835 [Melioribacteraceae bacterium]|nr:hypothetical protein [Melioribacteraceae bacterium]
MRKLFFILLLSLLFFGCDGVDDSIVDPNDGEFSVADITAPTSLKYSGGNTKLNTSITFTDSKSIIRAWIKLASQDGTVVVTYQKDMEKSSENKYSTSVAMDTLMPSLTYTIDYFYQTELQEKKKIASHNFVYDNMQNNIAPVISNPLFYYIDEDPMLRDTLENNKEFIFSIDVDDANGLSDIDSVYTYFYSPNNPSALLFILYDNGDDKNGDETAGDGIYSGKNIFAQGTEGNRKFEFLARDRAGLLSNTITHNVVVK